MAHGDVEHGEVEGRPAARMQDLAEARARQVAGQRDERRRPVVRHGEVL